jgi:serine/threonine protein kinase
MGKSKDVGPAADVYALGAILYECLTGRPPFWGPSGIDTLQQVCNDEPVAVRRLQPRVPRDLDTITLKCLEKDPNRRYGTAEALADDLGRYLDGKPIIARPINNLERAWRWCRRNKTVAVLLSTLVVALVTGAVVSTYFAVMAHARLQDYRGLADNRLARQYQTELNELLVPDSNQVPLLENWLTHAQELAARYRSHSERLATLRATADRVDDASLKRLQGIQTDMNDLERALDGVPPDRSLKHAEVADKLSGKLDQKTSFEKQTWSFADNTKQWEYDALTD